MTAETLRGFLEHAPKDAGPIVPQLRGWWVPAEGGLLYVCAEHAGRITARGCQLPGAQPVWRNRPEPYGVCACC